MKTQEAIELLKTLNKEGQDLEIDICIKKNISFKSKGMWIYQIKR